LRQRALAMDRFKRIEPSNWSTRPLVIVDQTGADTASISHEKQVAPCAQAATGQEIDSQFLEDQSTANFSSNEIAIIESTPTETLDVVNLIDANNFENDLKLADRQLSSPLYAAWYDKLNDCLSLAYALYLHVLIDPGKLNRLLEASYFETSRKRALSKGKVALAALLYVTRPEKQRDRKSASAYATMLIYAKKKGVKAERFGTEMANVTLHDARKFVRGLSEENASKREKAVAKPTLTVSYRSEGATRRHVLEEAFFSTESDRLLLAEKIVDILQKFQEPAL
jgi:hypothetical protein